MGENHFFHVRDTQYYNWHIL